MPELEAVALVKTIQSLLVERGALARKERDLVGALNGVLKTMGYEVMPLAMRTPSRRGAGRRRAGPRRRERSEARRPPETRKRRRVRMSGAARRAASQRMKAYWVKRRAETAKRKSKSGK